MFMRILQVKIKPGETQGLARLYEDRIMPALRAAGGCLSAFLLQNTYRTEEAISLTVWQSEEDSLKYERSGLFMRLVGEARPFFAESTEWKLQLSRDFTLEYSADVSDPVVRTYAISATAGTTTLSQHKPLQMFLRIVSLRLKPGKFEEYKRLYQKEIIPALLATRGCHYACLSTPSEDSNETLSITLWHSRAEAEEYEHKGIFNELLQKVKHTLSELTQLNMESAGTRLPSTTSEDIEVEGFHLIAGKSLSVNESS